MAMGKAYTLIAASVSHILYYQITKKFFAPQNYRANFTSHLYFKASFFSAGRTIKRSEYFCNNQYTTPPFQYMCLAHVTL